MLTLLLLPHCCFITGWMTPDIETRHSTEGHINEGRIYIGHSIEGHINTLHSTEGHINTGHSIEDTLMKDTLKQVASYRTYSVSDTFLLSRRPCKTDRHTDPSSHDEQNQQETGRLVVGGRYNNNICVCKGTTDR
ncbi:hypothetical protein Pcinc_020506 [Petrolisthes cinctipes]|uniref:Uncharacterized protein n=1 Tax=Petrolisthes cinctipes TaxID=88211 RepID=A0AAE1FK24_PETCI|nr:hypothetical protein Pcinc_020506 [Petrolisthes cinctipes]